MRLLVAVVLVGCAAEPEGPAKTPSTPIPTTLSVFERLHDAPGLVAGLSGIRITHRVDPDHCGGIAVTAHRQGDVPYEDTALAHMLEVAAPTGLDFSEATKAASLKRMDAWVMELNKRGTLARNYYSARMRDEDASQKDRVIAAARLVQVQRHYASTLVRVEIPVDVRTGEFAEDMTGAFCGRIAEVAEPIMLVGEGAAKICAEQARDLAPGWWTRVCVLTPGPVTASAAPLPSR